MLEGDNEGGDERSGKADACKGVGVSGGKRGPSKNGMFVSDKKKVVLTCNKNDDPYINKQGTDLYQQDRRSNRHRAHWQGQALQTAQAQEHRPQIGGIHLNK